MDDRKPSASGAGTDADLRGPLAPTMTAPDAVRGSGRIARIGRGLADRVLRGRPGMYLFVAVACLNFASMSREVPWGDARPVYEVAESLIHGRGVAVPTRWPSDAPTGRGGKYYAAQPVLPSLLHLPGVSLRALFYNIHVGPEVAHLLDALCCHLACSLLGALVVLLFFRLCLRHGASPQVARFGAILLAAGSILWVYARYPFTEIVQIACFTGFFLELSQLAKRLDRRTALAVGVWAGLMLNTKYIYVLCLPGALAVVALAHRKTLRPLLNAVALAAIGLLPGLLVILAYNYWRFGSVTSTGYLNVGNVMVENVLISTWGFLFSPGKSLFLYTPPLVLAALALPRFWRGHRLTALAMVATILPVMLFYARFPSWSGDWAWGPRYMVFAVPVLLLPSIAFLSVMRWPGRSLAAALLVVGLCVQILGNAFYWDHYLRIVLDVRTKWLGQVNRTGALTADKGGYCEGCFEDVYPMVWLGPFQPILGHLWMLRHVPFHHDWRKASADSPWRRHTRLDIDARGTWDRVRMDHWLYDTHQHRAAGWIVLLVLAGVGTAAGVRFVRAPAAGLRANSGQRPAQRLARTGD